jgi:hypothetical protein
MNTPALLKCLVGGLALCAVHLVSGQTGLPVKQPKYLTIVREEVKPGMGGDHARHEAGWPAAFEKAKSPDYYLAMTSLTGPSVGWYMIPAESNAAIGEAMKREDKDPTLSAELGRLARRDAEFISRTSVLQLVACPEISLGAFPVLAKARFYEVTQFTVKTGQEMKFEKVLKTYNAARKRVAPDSSYRCYMVVAGMPGPTYFLMISAEDYGRFDQEAANHAKVFQSATAEENAEFDKWGDIVVREETQRFRLDPGQSYVSKETRATDPEFWMPK